MSTLHRISRSLVSLWDLKIPMPQFHSSRGISPLLMAPVVFPWQLRPGSSPICPFRQGLNRRHCDIRSPKNKPSFSQFWLLHEVWLHGSTACLAVALYTEDCVQRLYGHCTTWDKRLFGQLVTIWYGSREVPLVPRFFTWQDLRWNILAA